MSVSQKIALPVFSVLIVCFCLLILSLDWSMKAALNGYFESDVAYKADQLKTMLDGRERQALSATAWFESSSRLSSAFLKKERASVIELGKSAMDSFGLDYFVVTDTHGKVFARAHAPDQFDDDISNQLNIQKALLGERSVFLEEGSLVKYSIRAGTPLRAPNGTIIGAISIGFVLSNDAFVDSMKGVFGCDVTVFSGTTRIATTIEKDGKRIEDTKLGNPQVEQDVLKEGKRFLGSSKIDGVPYFVCYQPLRGQDGNPTGMLFIGEPMGITQSLTLRILILNLLAFALLLVVVMVAIALTVRKTLRPLVVMSGLLQERGRDLSIRFEEGQKDEIGGIARNLNGYMEGLKGLISGAKEFGKRGADIGATLAESATEVSATVEEISATMESIRDKTEALGSAVDSSSDAVKDIDARMEDIVRQLEDQAASVTESSATIEQLLSSISSIDAQTTEKRKLSKELVESATKGHQEMDSTLSSIVSVGHSANDILELVAVIKAVADQTNLLAMNAAIEAAHAGQFGRGFAVVADEIRKLAETTAQQARDINETVGTVIESIQLAEASSERTGATMGEIVAGIRAIDGAMDETSRALSEMSCGTDQISGELKRIVASSQTVRESGLKIRQETASIATSVSLVADRSRENILGVKESSLALSEIEKAMIVLSEKGSENQTVIEELEGKLSQFKTE